VIPAASLDCAKLLRASHCQAARSVAYIHVMKTGGTSISAGLHKCTSNRIARSSGKLFHDSARIVIKRAETKSHQRASKLFFFAATRNPYERLVSLFYFTLGICIRVRGGRADHCDEGLLPSEKIRALRRDNVSEMASAFHDWIVESDAKYPVGSKNNYMFSRGKFMRRRDSSQIAWLDGFEKENGAMFWFDTTVLNDVYREILDTCMPECSNQSAIPPKHLNPTVHASAELYYVGERGLAAARIVEKQAHRDFVELGYPKGQFSGPPAAACGFVRGGTSV